MTTADLDRVDLGLAAVLAGLGLLVPMVLSGYEIKLATTITIQAGLAVALGFVVGPGGLISLGHAAFYGVAAYIFAMIAPQTEPASLLSTLLVSIAGTGLFALVVGAVSLRARGLYFVLMTLAFGQLAYHFFHDTGVGGSADGTYVYFRPELRVPGLSIAFEQPWRFYLLVYGMVLACMAVAWWLRRSAFGSVLIAARDNEARVRAFGFSPYAARLIAFVISGGMAGVMGYLTAAQNGFVVPEMLGWHASAIALVMVLIGGKDTVSGPVIGAVVLLIAEEVLQRLTEHWLIGVGLIIIAVVLIAPRGVVPFGTRIATPQWQRLQRWRHERWRHG
jgi:branched-chain amino acid transport system permease protein